jgi:predicted metalloprotease with PDZ domain
MKKQLAVLLLASLFWSCKTSQSLSSPTKDKVQAILNLNEIKDDKVLVTIHPPKIKTDEVNYYIPKIVPGTYSEDNYGKYVADVKAYDAKGKHMVVIKKDDNTWTISNAKALKKLTYWVNDTFDTEKGEGFGNTDIFSPAGSNIKENTNFMINMHAFVGYFQDNTDIPYEVRVVHPKTLWGATSLIDLDTTATADKYTTARYAELVENPVMYAKPDYTTFTVDDMDILISVYSPTGKYTAESITPGMKKMINAQKQFLGKINSTKKYSVLLYLSTLQQNDAKGFGALEHPTATTVVLPEAMPKEELEKTMMDVVSHEFFHIVTPLTIHAKEIQYFDYNNPKMSEHLWMYEGVTEYFANLFQIKQDLITEEDFYTRIAEKIERATAMNDAMPMTTMSKNVLTQPYKDQYLNVYEKGALIGMCLDIIIREKSNGTKGILDLMQKLSNEYGVTKPFNDDELFTKITALTYPEVGAFLTTYVAGTTPIPYDIYLSKVGVSKSTEKVPASIFIKGKEPYISINPQTKEIIVLPNIELNEFFTHLDLKGEDIILAVNDKSYDLDNIYELISDSQKWIENETISIKMKRDGKEKTIKGTIKLPHEEKTIYKATDSTKTGLKEAWLKG